MGILESIPFMSVSQRGSSSLATIRVTGTYMFPYKEDLVRFDFEVAPEDEYMWHFAPVPGASE